MSATTYYRIRVYVGPVHVEHYAETARANGLTNVFAGTAHVYGTFASETAETDTDKLVTRQRAGQLVYGEPCHTTVWRDVEILR